MSPTSISFDFIYCRYSASLGKDLYVIASLWGYVQIFDGYGRVLAYLCKVMTPVMIGRPPPWKPQF
jgi:hypothetical protein